ncbi:hypothetical protein AGMMS49992_18330 [Clostridia bacterium]|nr:hypothetical protein AGMMS49992_18330 [Clostridia bacterium]
MPDIPYNALSIIKESVLKVVPDTEAIYLFGSYAYGTPHKDSDLDVYVVLPDTITRHPLDIGVDIRDAMPLEFPYPMDLIANKSSVFKRRSKLPTIQKTIADKGVVIYAR